MASVFQTFGCDLDPRFCLLADLLAKAFTVQRQPAIFTSEFMHGSEQKEEPRRIVGGGSDEGSAVSKFRAGTGHPPVVLLDRQHRFDHTLLDAFSLGNRR